MSSDENVDVLNENWEVIGSEKKNIAHKKGLLHKTVIGYLYKDGVWRLVRQSSTRQDAGQLVAPVGGHLVKGETEDEALLREAEEEIGTRNITYKLLGRKVYRRKVIGRDENHLFVVYEISTDDPIVLNHESVEIISFTYDELKREIRKNPKEFGDAFYAAFGEFYPEFLE